MRHSLLIVLRLPFLLAICLVLATCGSGDQESLSTPVFEPGTDAASPGGGFILGPPSELLRSLSLVDRDRLLLGSEYEDQLPANKVTPDETTLTFSPAWVPPAQATMADLAYALFAFSIEGYNGDPLLEIGWDTEPADLGNVYIGLGNYINDRWDWKSAPITGPLDFTPLNGYVIDGKLLLAVVVTGESPATLGYLKVGENVPPEALIKADPALGDAPLDVDFDAGDSVDHDGTITFYSWDLDGDGTFETGPFMDPTTSNTYNTPGTYDVSVRISDNSGAQDIATVLINANVAGNVLPTAVLTAAPLSGNPPLVVDFDASSSDDPDGAIVLTQWDIDGDGQFSETGPEADAEDDQMPQFTFTEIGDHPVTVRIQDDVGVSDTATELISVIAAPNENPQAILHASPTFGSGPLTVNFDASDSFDNDGTINTYEWDWESDGTYDANGPSPVNSHTYLAVGTYTATLRVTDNSAGADTAYVTVLVDTGQQYDEVEPNNTNETANALPAPGFSGFEANLGPGGYDGGTEDWYSMFLYTGYIYTTRMTDFLGIVANLDMELYKWDDLVTPVAGSTSATGNEEVFNFGPLESGEYYLKCYRVGETGLTNYTLGMIYGVAVPPVAELTANPTSGPWPLSTTFDARGSSDPDGTIDDYEWDLDGNGTFNEPGAEEDSRNNANPAVVLNTSGTYDCTVRVTDNMGITNTASVEVSVINDPPVASFIATPAAGDRPLTVDLDASASFDPEPSGGIVLYEWDFDANGVIDLSKTDADTDPPLADAVFWILDPNCTLTVTDVSGQTDTAVVVIDINALPDSETEINGTPEQANILPGFPLADYWGHVGPLPDGENPEDENDWFKFTVSDSGNLDLLCEFADLYGDIDIFLYREGDYTTILAQGISATDNETFVPPPSLSAGTYYLHVEIWDGEEPLLQGGYRLSATFE